MLTLYKKQLKLLAMVAAMLIFVHACNLLTAYSLSQFGLVPREVHTLGFIFTAPWLHGTTTHLMANLFPLLIFMWLCMQWGMRTFLLTIVTIVVLSGVGVWLFGRHASHIGASGVVYGLFGFLLVAGYLSGKLRYLLISLLVAAFYGSMIIGVLPMKSFVSFEYHLFGFVAGIFSAWTWARKVNPV